MYIAFRWLVFLALSMWVAMCLIDTSINQSLKKLNIDIVGKPNIYKNQSVKIQLMPILVKTEDALHSYHDRDQNTAGLHFFMFIAGALAVTALHKKPDIIKLAKRKIPTLNMVIFRLFHHSKIAATKSRIAIAQYSLHFREKIKTILLKLRNKINNLKKMPAVRQNKIHIILLQKMKEIAEERKNLGQLLISALHENKNIRMRYELEAMTKNRLMQHMEDTQKQIKENRSRYVSFQQLYLLTHQENTYLKARLIKLKQEKDKSVKDLMELINEVYISKNKDLKMYCARFLVKTKDNLLNSDVGAEIKEFLENSRKPSGLNLPQNTQYNHTNIPSCTRIQITEIVNEEDCLVPISPDAPQLRGLPGECVWTLKDKDGIIEKLYDYESNLDRGDTIKRIRQYSVYFDKDCLLDFGRTEIEANITSYSSRSNSTVLNQSSSNKKIVTGSEAFQIFLRNCTSVVQIKPNASPLL